MPNRRDLCHSGSQFRNRSDESRTVTLESDSRQVEMKPGEPLEVKMRGQGCAGLVVFSK